jgi:hypothetical protein
MSNRQEYALKVRWDETATPGLPTLIGPFATQAEALDFIRTSVPNGVAEILALAYPYSRGNSEARVGEVGAPR